jgi:hypothetical protein
LHTEAAANRSARGQDAHGGLSVAGLLVLLVLLVLPA